MADIETGRGDGEPGRFEVVVPARDLHAWPVRTEDGEHLGHVRGINTDEDGHIVSLDVRERWILGPHHLVPAGGMRITHGEVVVPRSASREMLEHELEWLPHEEVAGSREQALEPLPVFVRGRDGARRIFGGLDPIGSLLGALVSIAAIALATALLAAALETSPALDTSAASFAAASSDAVLALAACALAGGLLGGWAAGRSSRYDGEANGLLAMAWLLALGAAFTGLGRSAGSEWNAFAAIGMPSVVTERFEVWGVLAFLVLVALVAGASAIGGALGEAWHRHADRVMLEVVQLAPGERHRPRRRRRPHDGMP